MSTLTVGTISEKVTDAGVSVDGVTLKDGELGTTSNPVAIHSTSLNGGQFGGRRNMVINGAMQVAQRGTSSSTTSSGYKTVDRINNVASNLGASNNNITMSQVTDAPTGFSNSFKVNIDAAESPLSNAGTSFDIRQRFEGQNLQHLKKGTSDAEKVTLSFYVKSNKTGTYIVQLLDKDNNRNISKSYTIDSSSTWEYKTITFEGDTTGTFDNDNARSLDLIFALFKGTTYTSGTLATSWESQTNANEAVGQVNLADTLNNFWQITGVQLEVGEQATPFEHLSYGETEKLCQRYYYKQADGSENASQSVGVAFMESSSVVVCCVDLPTTMRASPSNVSSSVTDGFQFYRNGAADNFTDTYIANSHPNIFTFFNHTQVSGTAGQAGSIKLNSSATSFIAVDAEL